MPASTVSDYLFSAEPRWAGKIGSAGVAAANTTTIPLSSAANLNNGEAYVFTINRVTSDGTKNTLAQMETCIGELSGTNFINCTRGVEGTASAWAADIVVEILFTATHWSKLVTWAEVAHNQDGTHKSGSVLTLPQINDTSADHQYVLAVNELTADITITLPLLTGADEFVFKDHTQTLTNKTLTSPTVNTPTLVLADTSPTADGSIGFDRTGEDLQIGDGSASQIVHMGAWTSYNPALTNVTIGSGTKAFAYSQVGKTVFYRGKITLAADSSIGGLIGIALPVTAKVDDGNMWECRALDSGTNSYVLSAFQATTGRLDIYALNAAGTYLAWSATSSSVPFTWTTSDAIIISVTYEVA